MTKRRRLQLFWAATAVVVVASLAGCGGGESNPFGNPATVVNPPGAGGQKLSFVYFQKCINPILLAQLTVNQSGVISTNSCAASGCHDNINGTGGALRVVPGATALNLADPANTPEVMRMSDMYKNFYSSQGATLIGSPAQSRLLTKPLVQGVLHGGGLIFDNPQDPNVRRMQYWIGRPMPQGQDEFSITASNSMFTPPDPTLGACNEQ